MLCADNGKAKQQEEERVMYLAGFLPSIRRLLNIEPTKETNPQKEEGSCYIEPI